MFFHLRVLYMCRKTTLPLCYRLQCLLLTLVAIFRPPGFVYLPQGGPLFIGLVSSASLGILCGNIM